MSVKNWTNASKEDINKITFTAGDPPDPEQYKLARYDEYYSPPITDPREADKYRSELLAYCRDWPAMMARVSSPEDSLEESIKEVEGFARYLASATVVLWKMELWQTATRGSEVFAKEIVTANLVNPPVQFWVPDRAYHIPKDVQDILGTGGRDELWATLVIEDDIAQKYGAFVTIPIFVKSMASPTAVQEIKDNPSLGIPFFKLMASVIGQPVEFRWQQDYLALCNFMKLQVVEVKQYTAPRPDRRRAMKAGHKMPDIRVVQLRRKTMKMDHLPDDPEHPVGKDREPMEWSCHWLVGAHWRQQWYPSKQKHEPKFIAPYTKGDVAKPFKAPSKTIYAIVR